MIRVAAALLCGAVLVLPAPAEAHSTCPIDHPGAAQLGGDTLKISVKTVASGKVLLVEGGIDASAPQVLGAALKAHTDISEVWIRSGGGNAAAGNLAGKVLRQSGLPVRIPAGWWCVSACNFLFFGGVFAGHMATVVNDEDYQRKVDELAQKGQSAQLLGEIAQQEQSMAKLTADDVDVILRMGISRKLLSDVMYAQRADKFRGTGSGTDRNAETYRCLTRDEMTRYNVVNVG